MYNTCERGNLAVSKPIRYKRKMRKIFKSSILIIILVLIIGYAAKYVLSLRAVDLSNADNQEINSLYDQSYLQYKAEKNCANNELSTERMHKFSCCFTKYAHMYNYGIISPMKKPASSETDKSESVDDDKNIDNANDNSTDNSLQNDYSFIVSETEAVGDEYFDDAVFIGDSRTEGFIMYNGLSNVTSLTSKGLMVNTVFTKPAINMNGEKLTIMKALANTKFNKVYIMLGVNELGWAFSDIFIEKYAEIIDYVREINENAQIYVQSILPVSYEKSSSDKIYNNMNINNYNALIKEMVNEKQVYYVDVAEAITGEDGNLPVDASLDGIHLKKEYCQKWYEYLKTHTVQDKINKEKDS